VRISWVTPTVALGGSERSLVEGAIALSSRGHEVHVIAPQRGWLSDELEGVAEFHVRAQNPWVHRSGGTRIAARWLLYDLVVARREIAGLIRDLGTDVVLTNTITTPAGALAARSARCPHVWYVKEFGRRDHSIRFMLGRRPSIKVVDHLSKVVIVNSRALLEHFSQFIPRDKLRLVYSAVVTPRVRVPSESRPVFRLLVVGNKVAGKGQRDAIEAVALLARRGLRVELDLVGRTVGSNGSAPDYESQLRALARSRNVDDRIRFLPSDPEPYDRIAGADVALICSRGEGLGRVTIEAMKLGTAVIGAADGGTEELVRDGWNGFLYPPGDVGALAARIESLHGDETARRIMSRRAQDWAHRNFTSARHGRELEAALVAAQRH
jgi:glycosyltransferase involved in cell wall biosynthesis